MNLSSDIENKLNRARSSLEAAKMLDEAGLLDDSASRSYYAAFHAASALLPVPLLFHSGNAIAQSLIRQS